MNLASPQILRSLLKKHRIRLSKKLGQIFLVNKIIVKKIVKAANLQPRDIVLEIGPGIGTLSQELVKRVKKLVVVEKDPKMIKILKEALKNFKNIEIVRGDILKYQIPNTKRGPSRSLQQQKSYKVVGNLPFYLTAPVIRKFLENEYPPKEMVLVVQKEVAQRVAARPPKMNLLAVSVQFYAHPEIINYISRQSFWPQPKVDGAIIKISRVKSRKSKVSQSLFFRIVKAGFSHPRKQLINNLSKELNLGRRVITNWLLKNGVQPNLRAEALRIEDWIKLTKSFKIN